MTTILDLPVHALAVHAPVILVPLLVLFGLLYLLVPPLRRRIGWVVAALTLIAPATAYASIWSGEQLATFIYEGSEWPDPVDEHRSYGLRLLWILIGLIPVWFLFAALERGRRAAVERNGGGSTQAEGEEGAAPAGEDPAAAGRRIFMIILGVIALVLLGLAAWMVFMSGDTGASMRWSDVMSS